MAGFLDFLLGNMMNSGGSGAAPGAPATGGMMPQGQPNPQSPQVPQINPLQSLLSNFMMSPQSQAGGMAPQGMSGAPANPDSLGVGVDASNPMKDENMRRMIMMQYMNKQRQGGQSPDMGMPGAMPLPSLPGRGAAMPNMASGGGMGGAMGGMGLNSMPPQMMNRKRFIGSSGM